MGDESDRVAVQTTVPRFQRERWRADAEAMDMSQAEFVRSMVQAGRHELGLDERAEETGSSDANPGGWDLDNRILQTLSGDTPTNREAIGTAVEDIFEDAVDEALDRLLQRNAISYRPGRGYVRTNGE